MSPFLQVKGKSNEEYTFSIMPYAAELPAVPAVYIVTRWMPNIAHKHIHHTVFVDETDDLAQTFNPHVLAHQFLGEHQANTICYFREPDSKVRKAILADLKASLDPECCKE